MVVVEPEAFGLSAKQPSLTVDSLTLSTRWKWMVI
jgi:hypothetical protein